MKRLLTGSTMMILCSLGAWAAPIDCNSVTNLGQLIAAGANGCEHQDKLFSNFAFTGSYNVNNIGAAHQFNGIAGGGPNDVHGFAFSFAGGFTTGFTLSYDVTVVTNCLVNPNCGPALGFDTSFQALYASKDQQNSGITPNATAITDTQTPVTLNVSGASTSTETQLKQYAPITTLHTVSVYTTSPGSAVQTYEQDFFEKNTAVPEPATMALGGGALVLLGLLRKRRAA